MDGNAGKYPKQHSPDPLESKLAKWRNNHCNNFQCQTLAAERVIELTQRVGTNWDAQEEKIWKLVADLIIWVQEHGELPHQNSSDAIEKQVEKWINNVRNSFAEDALPPNHAHALEQVPGWAWNAYERSFEDNRAAVTAWMREHGKTPCQGATDPSELRLAKWLNHQRNVYARDDLSRHRIAMLESLPDRTWCVRDFHWERMHADLVEWLHDRAGISPSSGSDDVRERTLAAWVRRQRQSFAGGALPLSRQLCLEAIPKWCWRPQDNRWHE